MGILRFVLWTALCIGLGVFLATFDMGGRTPLRMIQGAWKQQVPVLEKALDRPSEKPAPAKERHSKEEREAIDQLISKHSKG